MGDQELIAYLKRQGLDKDVAAAERIEELVMERDEAVRSAGKAANTGIEYYQHAMHAEAKLTKAVEALRWIIDHRGECFIPEPWDDMANAVLAELEGK